MNEDSHVWREWWASTPILNIIGAGAAALGPNCRDLLPLYQQW